MNRSPHPLNRPLQAGVLGAVIGALCFPLAHADLTLQMRDLTGGSDGNPNSTTEAETIIALAAPDATYDYTDHSDTRNTINVGNGSIGTADLLPDGSGTSDTYVLQATANLVIPAGTWSIGFQSDDGGRLIIPGITFDTETGTNGDAGLDDEVRYEGTRGPGWTWGSFTLASSLTTTIDALQFESGGGDGFQVAFRSGDGVSPFGSGWSLLEDGVNGWTVQVAPINDTDPPVISELSPADDSTGAYPAGDLVATFDEEIALTGSGTITVAEVGGDGSSDFTIDLSSLPDPDGTVSVVDTILSIDPTSNLEFGQEYEVTISSGAIEDTWTTPNAYGGTTSGEWTFTTAAQNLNAPAITSLDPADDATDVAPASNLIASFDQQILLIESPPMVLLDENFDSDDGGFTVKTTDAAGTQWSRGDPDSEGEFGGSVTSDNSGTGQAWATGLGDFTATGDRGYYADPTVTCLRSPVLDLTGVAGAELTFAEALDIPSGDVAEVNLIDDTSDTVIATVYTAVDEDTTSAPWMTANGGAAINLSAGIGQLVRLEWCFEGQGGATDDFLGWYIDDVQVTAANADSSIIVRNLDDGIDTAIPVNDASQVTVSGNDLIINPASSLSGGKNHAILIGDAALKNFSEVAFGGISDETVWNFSTSSTTTITGTAAGPGGANDTWNNADNWDGGVPSANLQAIIADDVVAQANNAATPVYNGGLTIGAGSELDIANTLGSENAIGTGPVAFNDGSTLRLRLDETVTIPGDIAFAGDARIVNSSNATDNEERFLSGNISGSGLFTYELRRGNILHLEGTNTWTGGFIGNNVDNNPANASRVRPGNSGFGTGDVTINDQIQLEILSGLGDTIDDGAALTLNGSGREGVKLQLDSDETVGALFRDGLRANPGTYDATTNPEMISGTGVLTVADSFTDTTVPTVVSIESPPAAATVFGLPTITYTVTFDKEMDDASLDSGDFSNLGTATFSVDAITPISGSLEPSAYTVDVTPTSGGTLQLQISGTITDTRTPANALATPVDDDLVYTFDAGPAPTKGTVSIVDFFEGTSAGGGGDKTVLAGLDASAGDKLVVVLGAEHGFPQNPGGGFNSLTYAGTEMVEAVQERDGVPTLAIFYLDDPGAAGDLVVNQENHNGTTYAIYVLSGTAPGLAVANKETARAVSAGASVVTGTQNSFVIAGICNAGPDGGNGADDMIADPPLNEDTLTDIEVGNRWTSLSAGSVSVAAPSADTYSFSGATSTDLLAVGVAAFEAADGTGGDSAYDTWASGFGLSGENASPELDFDGGGLDTGVEWVTGGDPSDGSDDASVAPTSDNSDADFFVFTFRRSDDAAADPNTTIEVEYGPDLVNWTTAVDDGTNVVITETDDGAGAGVDLVEVALRRSALGTNGQLFARLNVTVAVP
jgi:hypothetical protein